MMRLNAVRVMQVWLIVMLLCAFIIASKYHHLQQHKDSLKIKVAHVVQNHQGELRATEQKMWVNSLPPQFPKQSQQLSWLHQSLVGCGVLEENFEQKTLRAKNGKKQMSIHLQFVGRYQNVLCWLRVLAMQQNVLQLNALVMKATHAGVRANVILN